jgi:Pectate lyase superfamily protein/F5/8 type C domain
MAWRSWAVSLTVAVGLSAPWVARAQSALPVAATAQSSSQNAGLSAQNLVSDNGLVADANVAGGFRYLAWSANYTSGYGVPNDETPLVHFDFGVARTVGSFHVWNGNEPNYTWRGFRDVTLQTSNDGQRWQTLDMRLSFDQAPGNDSYAGQRVVLPRSVNARFIRIVCNSTWRNFGGDNTDIAALGRVRFFAGTESTDPVHSREHGHYPAAAGVINVKAAPYFARGDGVSDDTAALQRAITEWQGTGRAIYLPKGEYLVSAPLTFTENASYQRNGYYGRNVLRGSGADHTTIRLKDNSFTDAKAPKAVIANGFISFFNGQREETTADWFHNSVTDLRIDIGSGNPGAKGLEFFSNNTGAVRNVAITSADGQGVIGLDLGHQDKNGPLLVKNLVVKGFQVGVRSGQTVNSQTFENIELNEQGVAAFDNNGQSVSIRGLRTRGAVPALMNRYGFATLIDANLQGTGPAAAQAAAITNGEFLFARNIRSKGFALVVKNQLGKGADVASSFGGDYVSSGTTLSLLPGRRQSLGLHVLPTPELHRQRASEWANARDFRLTTETDDGPGLQRAIDSGARSVFLPGNARVVLKSVVFLRGHVEHLDGMNARVIAIVGARIRVVDADAPATVAEQFLVNSPADAPLFENASSRAFALVDSTSGLIGSGTGDVFLENVVGRFDFGAHRTFARQLNSEPEGDKIFNRGGKLWVLGLKTERAGTLVATSFGGATEILGGLCYTTTIGSAPMFTVTDGSLGVSLAEVSYAGAPYQTLVTEVQGGITKKLIRGQAPLRFSFLGGSALPLFVSRPTLRPTR